MIQYYIVQPTLQRGRAVKTGIADIIRFLFTLELSVVFTRFGKRSIVYTDRLSAILS